MSEHLAIPDADLERFGQIAKRKDRERVWMWMDILNAFTAAEDKCSAVTRLVAEYGGRAKISQGTLYRKLAAYKRDGWMGLLTKTAREKLLAETAPSTNFETFVAQMWRPLCMRSQRKTAAAYRSLFLDYLCAGKVIKGYDTDWRGIWRLEHKGQRAPAECPYVMDRVYPAGWSRRNLYHRAPDTFEQTAARIGMGAASALLPKVPTTRVGLPFGRVIMIDDLFHDTKVRLLGNREPQIVVELRAIELLTGSVYSWGVKPVRERDDGTKEHLRETFTRYLMADIFCRRGFCADGCLVCGELGTARLPETLVATLNRWAGRPDMIQFAAGGIVDGPIAKGLLAGRGRGNFRFKAALESSWNLYRNEIALLSGQKGADPKHAPEDLGNKVRHDKALMTACHALIKQRPEIVECVRGMFPSYHQYIEALGLINDRIDDRHDHHLEGYDECGFVVHEYSIHGDGNWKPVAELDAMAPEDAADIRAIIQRDPQRRYNVRVMSPREAREHCEARAELVRLPEAAVPEILGAELGTEAPVGDGEEIYIPDRYLVGKRYTVAAIVKTPLGRVRVLERKSRWLVHLNPFDGRVAYISTPDGEYIGKAPVVVAGSRIDTDALRRNLGILNAVKAREVKRLTPTAEDRLQEIHDATAHNVKVLAGETPIEDAQADAEADDERRERRHGSREDIDALLPAGVAADGAEDEDTGWGDDEAQGLDLIM